MNLYKVTLIGMQYGVANERPNGISYVVAESLEEAYAKVRTYLDKKNLGFVSERELKSIELLADTRDYGAGFRLYL